VKIAFLADGRLQVADGDASPQVIESDFVKDVYQRHLKHHQLNSWKQTDTGAGALTWGMGAGGENFDPEALVIRMLGLATAPQPDHLLYTLSTDAVHGLFRYNLADSTEQRLFHRNSCMVTDLSCHPSTGEIAIARGYENGSANIALTDPEGKDMRDLTEGDSRDEAPSWARGPGRKLLFQSAGVGRDSDGYAAGLGPASIEELDLDSGNMRTLLSAADRDYCAPQMDADGNLYCIRRPHQHGDRHFSPLQLLKDIFLFPFRLVRAVFHFLNFFSMLFSGKPLAQSASRDTAVPPGLKNMVLYGKVVDTEKALKAAKKDDSAPLVPNDWLLTRRSKKGEEAILARGVAAYQLATDGTVVYSNGQAIFRLSPEGTPECLQKGKFISNLTILDQSPPTKSN
jgi:hypothetical protein